MNFLWAVVFTIACQSMWAQEFDLLIKNGHLIDAKNKLDQPMDVAVRDGKIAEVAARIPAEKAKQVIDAEGLYVVPGLIDMHVHVFHGINQDQYIANSFTSLPPDGFTFRHGVTTVVDAGSSGWRNFKTFREQTIDNSKTRVLAFINIVGWGMKGGAVEQNLGDMDPKLTAIVARQNKDVIVGTKLAHYSGHDWTPLERTVEAGELAGGIPAMIDFGGATPPLSIETLLLEKLRPGDIYAHCYAHVGGRMPVVDENGKVRPCVHQAQQKGVLFEVGHGGGSFVYEQALPALEQGFLPDMISTDLHSGSMNAGMKDMLNVMSKFLNMGLSMEDVIARSTWAPAVHLNREELGNLSVGAHADIAVLSLKEGDFGFTDVRGWKMSGDKKLECELTLMEGKVVWDLNGISMQEWQSSK